MTAMTESQWMDLMTEHELAYFRADVCLGSPQSYSIEEKRAICEGMEASTAEVDAALRADFEALPFELQACLLDMLCASGCMSPEWWRKILLGAMPDSVRDINA